MAAQLVLQHCNVAPRTTALKKPGQLRLLTTLKWGKITKSNKKTDQNYDLSLNWSFINS